MARRKTGNGRDSDRLIEEHRQTEQKLEVLRRYTYLWGIILAQGEWGGRRPHLFIIDTHGGTGEYKSQERLWVPGSTVMACFAARRIQQLVPNARVHVRAVEADGLSAWELSSRIKPFKDASGAGRVDVEVTEGDYRDHLERLADEVDRWRAPALWVVDPHGSDVSFESLRPLQEARGRQEVVINLDAGGAFRADSQPLASLDDLAVLDAAILGVHSMAINRLWGGHDWIDLVSLRGKSWRQNLQAFAIGYAGRFSRDFEFASAYPLRSSHNQIRYLIHLARHERGRDKFKEAFEASERFGLLAIGKLDQVAAFKAAEAYHSHYRNSTTTIEQLLEERLGTYAKQDLLTICDAAQTYGLGSFDPRHRLITWHNERLNLDALLFDVAAG